jgi:hypothetical protein
MDASVEFLVNEIAKPVDRLRREDVLSAIGRLDATVVEHSQIIFFLLESLFEFVKRPGSTLAFGDLLRRVLGNPTLLPLIYQMNLEPTGTDPTTDQMIEFVHSFQKAD